MIKVKDFPDAWELYDKGNIKEGIAFCTDSYGGVIRKFEKQEKPYWLDALGLPVKTKIVEI